MTPRSYVFMGFAMVVLSTGCGRKSDAEGAQTHYRLAMVEMQHAAHDERAWRTALAHIDHSLRKHETVEALATKAHLLVMLQQHEQAITCFESVLKREPAGRRRSDIENNYACALAANGRSDEAHEIWERLCASGDYLTPEVALVNRGRAYLMAGERKQAEKMLTMAVATAPDYVDARDYLHGLQAANDGGMTPDPSIQRPTDHEQRS